MDLPLSPSVDFQVEFPQKPGFRNAAVTSAETASPFTASNKKIILNITLKNFTDSPAKGVLRVALGQKNVFSEDMELSANDTLKKTVFLTPEKFAPADGSVEFDTDDDIIPDNTRYFALNPVKLPRIAISGKDNLSYFIRLAFQPSAANKSAEILPLTAENIAKSDLLILMNDIPDDAISSVMNFIEEGKSAVVMAGEKARANKTLLRFGIKLSPPRNNETEHFSEINFEHPVFKKFSEVKVGGFFEIAFFKTAKLNLPEGCDILAVFSNGDPAVAELKIKKGKLIVIASTFERESSDWAIHPTFLPFMRELLNYCVGAGEEKTSLHIGGFIRAKGTEGVIDLKTSALVGDGNGFAPTSPGNYQLRDHAGKIFSANTPPEESEPLLLPENFDFLKLISTEKNSEKEMSPAAIHPYGKTFWRIILAASMILLFSELLISNRTAL
jgi:hypothetical protein